MIQILVTQTFSNVLNVFEISFSGRIILSFIIYFLHCHDSFNEWRIYNDHNRKAHIIKKTNRI